MLLGVEKLKKKSRIVCLKRNRKISDLKIKNRSKIEKNFIDAKPIKIEAYFQVSSFFKYKIENQDLEADILIDKCQI